MASSLDPFRKHSKLIFTILGVICMITFVVGSQLEQLLAPARNQGRNELVATWSGGKIHEEDVYKLRARHQRVQAFLQGIARATTQAGGQPRMAMALRPISSERELVNSLLLQDQAKKMGILVDDASVRSYINDFCSYQLTDAQINDIAHDATGNTVSRDELYEQLKRELSAQEAILAMNSDRVAGNISVADAWDYHGRLFRRMSIEAYPFETAAYLDEVKGSPNEGEKRKIFEEFRLNNPDPDSSEPGFYRPLKLAFAYAKVDMAPFLEEAKKKITEEQIKTEYETQVKQGRLKVPVEEPKKEEEKKEDEKKPEDGEKKDGEEKKDSAPEEKKEDKKDEKPAEEPKKACGDELDGDELAQAEDAKQPEKKEPEKQEPALNPADPAKPAEEAKPDDKKPEDAKTDEEAKPKALEPKEPEMRVQTLDEVRDLLHTQLAQPAANEKAEKAATGISNAIRDYYSKYLRYQELSKRPLAATSKVEKPEPLDIEAIAKKYDCVGATTPLVNRYEVTQYDIGRNGQEFNQAAVQMRLDMSMWLISFPDMVYDPRVQLFNASEIGSKERDVRYVFCVTEKQDAANPKYEDADVQKEIIAAWKKAEALKLAKAAAEKLATSAKDKESLKDVSQDKTKVITPAPFSFYTFGSVPFGAGSPRFSPVEGVPNAQREFYETAYGLQTGGTGVATDGGFNTVYAVKLLGQTPPDEVLREQFLNSGINQQILAVANIELSRRGVAQLKQLEQSHNLKWARPAGFLDSGE